MKIIKAYHYTNPKAYRSMQAGGIEGYSCVESHLNKFCGLIPRKRFIRLSGKSKLPDKAYDGVIEGLLEPEPKSWINNPMFPTLWESLMHDICREEQIMLLSFTLKKSDKAFVVERAHMENEFYRKARGFGEPTKEQMQEAYRRYWESRVPALEYDERCNYTLPQLSIWSPISLPRLKVEWVKDTDEFWQYSRKFADKLAPQFKKLYPNYEREGGEK